MPCSHLSLAACLASSAANGSTNVRNALLRAGSSVFPILLNIIENGLKPSALGMFL